MLQETEEGADSPISPAPSKTSFGGSDDPSETSSEGSVGASTLEGSTTLVSTTGSGRSAGMVLSPGAANPSGSWSLAGRLLTGVATSATPLSMDAFKSCAGHNHTLYGHVWWKENHHWKNNWIKEKQSLAPLALWVQPWFWKCLLVEKLQDQTPSCWPQRQGFHSKTL